jgi:hypothetical protein
MRIFAAQLRRPAGDGPAIREPGRILLFPGILP